MCMLATCNVFFQDRTVVPEACKLLMMRLMGDGNGFGQPSDDSAQQYQLEDATMYADGLIRGNTSSTIAQGTHISDQSFSLGYGNATDEAALLQACEDAVGSGVGFPIGLPSPTVDAGCEPPEPVYLYPSCTLQSEETPLTESPSSGLSSSPAYVYPSFVPSVDGNVRSGRSSASTTSPSRNFSPGTSSRVSWIR